MYQFSRVKVERGDFRPFLDRFALDKLPTGRRLREMMNSVVFCVDGYDHDPREIHTIPEVRRFYAAFHVTGRLKRDHLGTKVVPFEISKSPTWVVLFSDLT